MKMKVAGIQRIAGKSKATGADFDMCNLLILVAIENVNNAKIQINGVGFNIKEMPCAKEALVKFMQIPSDAFPMDLEIETEPRPSIKGFETVVVGYKLPQALKAA